MTSGIPLVNSNIQSHVWDLYFGAGCSCFIMYIEAVPNRNSPPGIPLRESDREGGKGS
jgi:hypothetical protein